MDEPDVDALLSEAETARIDFENSKQCLSRTKGHYDVRKGIVDVWWSRLSLLSVINDKEALINVHWDTCIQCSFQNLSHALPACW